MKLYDLARYAGIGHVPSNARRTPDGFRWRWTEEPCELAFTVVAGRGVLHCPQLGVRVDIGHPPYSSHQLRLLIRSVDALRRRMW